MVQMDEFWIALVVVVITGMNIAFMTAELMLYNANICTY